MKPYLRFFLTKATLLGVISIFDDKLSINYSYDLFVLSNCARPSK